MLSQVTWSDAMLGLSPQTSCNLQKPPLFWGPVLNTSLWGLKQRKQMPSLYSLVTNMSPIHCVSLLMPTLGKWTPNHTARMP